MKKLLFVLLGLVVLAVAAVFVVPGFVDWNAYKGRITNEAEALTGRALAIEGDISLSLLPVPALSAGKIRLANIEGGSAPHLAKVEELRLRVALLPLLRGDVQVESFALIEPEILLEELPDGRRNWEFQQRPQSATQPAAGGDAGDAAPGDTGSDRQIRFDRVDIRGGSLVIATPDIEERLDDLDAEISAESLRGPFLVSGSAEVRGLTPRFAVSLGRLIDSGASSLSFELFLGDSKLQFGGALSNHPDGTSLRGKLRMEGPSLAALADELAGAEAAALSGLTQAFSLTTTLSADEKLVKAESVAIRFGDLSIAGGFEAALAEPIDMRANLAIKRLDLDSLLSALGTPGADAERQSEGAPQAESAQPPAQSTVTQKPPFALPHAFNLSLQASVDALVYRQQVIRQLRLEARLAEGEVDLGRFIALLPGGSDVALTGKLRSGENGPRFEGGVEAASDNLRGLLTWVGVPVGSVPSDRLRKMSFSSQLVVTPEQLTATRLDLRLDVSRVTGGVAVALRDRPGLGIGLKLDKLNLDAYLSEPPAVAAETAPADTAQTAPRQDGATAAPAGVLEPLAGFDANMDIKIGSLTFQGVPMRDLHLDGTLQNGAMTFRQLRVGDVAGAQGRFLGTLSDLATDPSLDGRFEFDTREAGRLAKTAGLDAAAVGPFQEISLRADVAGTREALSFDGSIATLGGRFSLAGLAKPLDAAFDVQLDAEHPSLPGFLHAAGAPLALNPDLGQLQLSARVSGTPLVLRAEDLRADLGGIPVSGNVEIDLSGNRPLVALDLETGDLPFDEILADESGGGGGQGGSLHPRWSRETIDTAGLEAIDADLMLRSSAFLTGGMRLQAALLQATLRDSVIDLQRFSGVFYEGTVEGKGRIETGGALAADMELEIRELDLQLLLREIADSDRFSGPLNIKARLDSQGQSEAELVSALRGDGELSGSLAVKTKVEEQAATALLGLLGKKVKEVRGLTDATAVLFQAFAGPPSELSGSFAIEQGLVTTRDTTIAGRDATAVTSADISLPAWQIDSSTTVYRSIEPQTPYLTAAARGPLDGPNVKISGQPFQRRTTSEPSAAGPQPTGAQPSAGDAAQPAQQPQDIKKLKPADVLKQLLKGLE